MYRKSILLTFDVEDWFQVENLKPWIDRSSWSSYRLRVEKNVNTILDILESAAKFSHEHTNQKAGNFSKNNRRPASVRATFFVLGWIAERLPSLLRQISDRGHELSSHGYTHKLCNLMSDSELKDELERSKKIIEDITSNRVIGFRASSFSVDDKVLEMIQQSGYHYDSSYNSFKFHGRYGIVDLKKMKKMGAVYKINKEFYEIPISNLKIANTSLPWGGGAYFRILPYRLFETGVRFILSKTNTYTFYLHPWEIDPKQPRLKNLPIITKLKHYSNLSNTKSKFIKFLKNSNYFRFRTCKQYLVDNNMLSE